MRNFSISLYAFHLCHTLTDAPGEAAPDASVLWDNLTNLGKDRELLPFPGLPNLKSKLVSYQNGIYAPQRELGRINEWLTDSGSLDLGSVAAAGFKIKGNIEPFRLNDTYAADFTISPESPDLSIDVPQLQQFNPKGLLPSSIEASLGQTLLLSGKTDKNDEDCKTLAQDFAVALLQGTSLDLDTVVKQGKLLGSLLFEYQAIDRNAPQNPAKQCHILVWLNNSNAATAKLASQAYDWLRDLLCCRHKIRYVDYQSRLSYQNARKLYNELEKQGQNLQQLPADPQQRLGSLKKSLTEVSTKLFEYNCHLRDLQAHSTTIETNAINYDRCLNNILKLPENDLGFWADFLTVESNKFQKQIQTDLNYLNPGKELFQQLITAIRGVVEIEQVESDRQNLQQLKTNEQDEKAREKQLENTLKAVGVGLTAGTSTASATAISVSRIDRFVNTKQLEQPPWIPGFIVLLSIVLSIILGLGLGFISYKKVKKQLDNSKKGSQAPNPLPPSSNNPQLPSTNP